MYSLPRASRFESQLCQFFISFFEDFLRQTLNPILTLVKKLAQLILSRVSGVVVWRALITLKFQVRISLEPLNFCTILKNYVYKKMIAKRDSNRGPLVNNEYTFNHYAIVTACHQLREMFQTTKSTDRMMI